MHTEEQAREKECRIGGPYNRTIGGSGSHLTWPTCSASRCGHWRWETRDEILIPEDSEAPEPFYNFATTTFGKTKFKVCRLKYSDKDGKPLPARGYCGLARGQT